MTVFNKGFRDESFAYALAAGLVVLDGDRDCEKALRRRRIERARQRRGERV